MIGGYRPVPAELDVGVVEVSADARATCFVLLNRPLGNLDAASESHTVATVGL